MEYGLIGLNDYQIQTVPYLEDGKMYRAFHLKQMYTYKYKIPYKKKDNLLYFRKVGNYPELSRLKKHSIFRKFDGNNVLFVQEEMNHSDEVVNPVLNVAEALQRLKETTNFISFQGLLCIKKFTPALTSRTENKVDYVGFGTPGKKEIRLLVKKTSLYWSSEKKVKVCQSLFSCKYKTDNHKYKLHSISWVMLKANFLKNT